MGKKIAILLVLLVPVNSWAADHLKNAKTLTAEMKYKQALWDINQVLKSPKSGPEEIKKAYELQGMCLAALGEKKAALLAYGHLLAIDIGYELSPRVSPKLRQPFDRARKLSHGKKPITLIHDKPKSLKKINGAKLQIKILGNPFGMVKRIRLCFAAGKDAEKHISRKVRRIGPMIFTLPAKLKATSATYYFEALTRNGGVLSRIGSKEKPYRLDLNQPVEGKVVAASPPEKKAAEQPVSNSVAVQKEKNNKTIGEMATEVASKEPAKTNAALPESGNEQPQDDDKKDEITTAWYKTWWFWTAVGVVAAGTATGVVLGVAGSGSSGEMRYDVYIK
jgi:hypothetical protein